MSVTCKLAAGADYCTFSKVPVSLPAPVILRNSPRCCGADALPGVSQTQPATPEVPVPVTELLAKFVSKNLSFEVPVNKT